jgi:hypothetical protein
MNHKPRSSSIRRAASFALLGLLSAFAVLSPEARAQSADKFYFWVTRAPEYYQAESTGESFVIEVDASIKAQIDEIAKRGFPGFAGRVAAGPVDYNKDYYAPGQPVWNWHIAAIDEIFDRNKTLFPQVVAPMYDAHPSDIAVNPAKWIQDNGDQYVPRRYWISRQVDPRKRDAMANVSNRGLTGAGEKTLITGLIITGGEPRNVVVRAMGPSLSSSGIQQAAANPKIDVYRGATKIATNADWKTDSRASELSQKYPSFAPTNDKEAAMLLTLMPGAYTLQGINEDGTEGIMLLEAYDVDSTTAP